MVEFNGRNLSKMKKKDCRAWLNPRRQWLGLGPVSSIASLEEMRAEIKDAWRKNIYASWYKGAPPPQLEAADETYEDVDIEIKRTKLHYMTNIWIAAYNGRLEEVQEYLKLGFDVDETQVGYPHDTPLHNAASGGQLNVVEYLISKGANVSLQEDSGNTALHLAARFGHADVVGALLNNSANDLDATLANHFGLTPRQLADKYSNALAAALLPADQARGYAASTHQAAEQPVV